ncbi:hypothetical protein EV177_008039 [Coemansia sp. RSA 1804]|nr:hypothetical protein EV177_008039 [Coemansia sp. RSA 1804]
MRTVSALIAAASAVVAQEIGFSGGASFSDGTNAISNPNVNNGWQSDSSLISSGGTSASAGPTTFNDVVGSSFTNINANTAIKDNLVNNPSVSQVKGNDGWTANGDSNALGPVQNLFGGFARRGDVVFADNHHQVQSQLVNEQALPAHVFSPTFVRPGFVSPIYRRSGDVVFADNHHQLQSQISNVQTGVPTQIHPGFTMSVFGVPQFVAGRVIKRDGDVVFANNQHDAQFATANFVNAPAFVPQLTSNWVVPVSTVVRPGVTVRPVVDEVVAAAPVLATAKQNNQKTTIVQNQA